MAVDMNKGQTRMLIDSASTDGMLRNQLAYVLATALWETAHTMEPVREAFWLSENWRRANLRYYPWYGRGFVQLTWEANYKRADVELHLKGDLVRSPDLALEPSIAARIILTGMTEGWFTGKKLSDYITLKKSDFLNARRIVNGVDQATTIASLASEYDVALREEGYGEEYVIPQTPPDPATVAIARLAALEAWAVTQGYHIPPDLLS